MYDHAYLANDYSSLGDDDAARAEAAAVERAVALSPGSAVGYMALAFTLNSLGKPAEALVAMDTEIRLNARSRNDGYLTDVQGIAYTLLGRSQEAIAARPYLAHYPNFWTHA